MISKISIEKRQSQVRLNDAKRTAIPKGIYIAEHS